MRIVYLNSDSPYIIGQQGETNAVTLRVDVTEWAADYPDGTGVILFTRPNKVVYPLETNKIVLDGKTYLQTIVTTKENKVPGWVVLQAQWYNGDVLVKSMLFSGKVLVSGDGTPVDPTETVPSWVTEWMDTLREAIDGAALLIEAAETMNEDLEASHQAVSDSEAWAKGTRSGEAVEPTDETYHNNSKYYSEQIASTAEDVEAWANGTRHGTDIDEEDPAYHKNGKYYSTQAAASAAAAAASASEAMTDTPEGYANVVASISPTYDGTKTYAVGAYCLNGGKLYRCTTAIDEPEATFNSAHWTQVNVGSEVVDLKSAVTDIEQMKYKAVLTAIGESNKQIFYANPGDTIEIKTADGSNFTANNVFFQRLDGTGPYWGLDHATNTKTVEIGTSNQNPIYYTYLYMGTAQKIIVTNLTSMYCLETAVNDLNSNKLDKTANLSIDVSEFAQIGSALRDGTIGGRTDRRYVKKGCENVTSLNIHTALWFVPAVLFYDSTGAVISTVEGNESGAQDITTNVPSGATAYAVNCAASNISDLTITEIMQYENAVSEVYNDVEAIKREIDTSGPELVLPAFYPAVVGFPSYVKYESILSNAYLRQYFVNFAGGVYGAFGDGYFDVPQSAGDVTKTFELYQDNKVIVKASTVQRAVAADAGGTAKCLIIGDSKSASQSPWVTLHDLLDADSNMSLTFLGTVKSGYIPREAYSGKSIINVCNDQYITGTTPNIFYDANVTTTNNHHFSFAKGVQTLEETPDIVIIDHGANQWASSWETVKGCYDDVIASIHAVDEDIKIVIVIQEGTGLAERPTHVTDGKWWLDNTSYANAHKLLDEYKNKETDNIFIMPTYMSVDLYRDFPLCKMPQFEGADGEFDVCMDGVHPGLNTSGWSASTQYKYGDWVSRNGNGYGCKKANSNTDPETDDGTYWAKCFNLGDGYKKKGMMYYYMLKYLMTVN